MNEIYIVDGKKYRVGLINKDDFLAKNPTAELFVEEEKEFGPQNEGKTSTTELDTTVDATEVSVTESLLADGSSESLLAKTSVVGDTLEKYTPPKKEKQKEEKPFEFWKQTVLSPEYEQAFEQLSKDTGEYSSVKGDGSFYSGVKNVGEYVKQLSKAVYQPMLTEEETTYDPINIDLLTRVQVAKELNPKQLDKLKKGGYTLKEKEDLLKKSKSKVIKNALDVFQKDINDKFKSLNEEQKVIEDRLVSTFGEIAPTSDSFVTQASVDLYNNLNQRLNTISKQKKEVYNEYKANTEELEAEYSFNLASGVIDNAFKLTDDVEEFNKSIKENTGTDLSARLVGGLWKTAGDIITFPGVVMAMAGDLFTDQDTYSSYDAFQDVLFNLTNYNALGDPGEAEVLDEEGKYVSDPKQYVRMTADMLPFTLGIIASAARGNTKGIQQSLSKAFPKRGIDKKLAQDISMGNAAFTMTFQDNVREGEKEGLSKGQAIAYGSAKSLGTAISQAVMPDVNFLKSAKGINILNNFKGSLKSAVNKKALSKASGQFFTSIGKELGEEEIEFVFDKANKISFGLALGDYDGFVREQKQLFAGTLMLSGGLGSFGATATGKAVKKQLYNGIIKDQQALLNELQTQRISAERSGNVENAEQLKKAEIFATDLIRASKVSPENVTTEQLDLVVEKQKLINEKKKLDSSFHGPINEQIADIDKQISESKVAQTKEEVAGKIKKGVEKLGKKLGFTPKTLKDNAAVEEYLNEVSPNKDNVKRAGELGFFVVKPDGSKEFVINEEANAKEGVITTEAHEALHYILYESVKNSPESQTALGEALIEELKKIDQGQIAGSDFAKRLNSYLTDPDITTSEALEEALTLFSEATLTGDIVYNENVMTKIGDFIRQTLQAIGIGQQIVFNDGRDVFNFIKDYNNSIKKGRADNFITEVAKKPVGKLIKPKTKADLKAEVKESRIVSPQATALKDVLSNEELVESIKSPTTEDKFSVAQAIVEKNWPVISKQIDFTPAQQDTAKEVVEEQILGVFQGSGQGKYSPRNTGLFNAFDPSVAQVNTYLGKTIGSRKPEIDLAIKERAGVTGEDLSKAEGITVTESTPAQVDTKKIKPSSLLPSDVVSKVKKEVKEKLKDVPTDKLTFKKLGNLAPEIIAEAIGIPVKKLTDATANLSKSDASAIQRFISQKPETLIKLLPEGAVLEAATQKLMGTSTGVPKSLLDAFYTKQDRTTDPSGLYPFKLNSNLNRAEFLEAFGIVDGKKAKDFSPRSAEAQRLKGIASLFGRLVTNEIARTEGDLSLETAKDVAAGKSRLMFSRSAGSQSNVNANVEKQGENVIKPGKDGVADFTEFLSGSLTTVFGKNANLFIKPSNLAGAGNSFISTRKTGGAKGRGFLFINDINRTNRFIKETKEALKKGEIGEIRALINTVNALENLKAIPESDLKAIKQAISNQTIKNIDGNLTNRDLHKKGVSSIINKFADLYNLDKKNIRGLAALIYHQNANSSFGRKMAPVLGLEEGVKPGSKSWEEHVYQFGNFANRTLQAVTSKDKKIIDGWIDWVNDNYYQEVTGKDTQGIVDSNYETNRFNGKALEKWKAKSEEHPYLFEKLNEAFKTGDFSNVPPADIRKYNEYFTLNPNNRSIDGVSDAVKYNVEVPKKLQSIAEVYEKQGELIYKQFIGEITAKEAQKQINEFVKIAPTVIKASKSNNDKSAFKFSKAPTNKVTIETAATTDKALNIARDLNAPVKKIRVFDFDDTLAQTKSDVLYTMPDGTEGKLNAEQFANDGSTLLSEGAVFDFSEFNKVTEGKKGPLFKVAQTIAAKRGTEDVFVLTARAPESQLAIYEFLKSQGLDIPLKNITGLGNSTGDAKARWIVDKAADGYNDFYFADDAPQNVKAVRDALSVIDVKSKTQQAKIKFSKSLDLNKDFNDIIENKTGIGSDKTYSSVKAEVAGASKGKFNFFIPPSAEDFVGLLYSTLGKGDVGDAQMAWYKSHLLNPFARAMENLANDRANMMQDFRGLKKSLGIVPKNLRKKIKDSNFTKEQAVRAYIWDKQGMEIPGISQKDQKDLVDFVNADAELVVFGDQLIEIGKGDAYAAPDAGWVAGNIGTDFIKALNTTKRSKYLETWQQNVDQIFSEANLNKLEAAYGANYREAMVDMLKRMRTGRNTSSGSDRLAARFTDWLTNSVGAIMFFNTRSAVLQTISAVNFINFSDNNVLKAGAAFANQSQYWSDFKKLFNSPFLLDRRSGLKLNVNEADIAAMAKGPGNSARNVIAGILKAGFLPTQIADSFAIASGGASFYRNRIKALQKEGLTEAEAEEQAFRDFREIAEESQQSSRPDKISQQQAGPLGRVILAFANTPAQYARLIKKAASDLKNGRGDAKTNISKIIYYGVAQNLLFSALQQAVFAIAFDDEEEEEKKNEKYFNIVNGMSDSVLRGIGIGGAIVSVVKNTALKLAKEADKKSPKYQDAVVKGILQISPPISSKVGKLQSAGKSYSWNQEEMRTRGWSIDNPAYLANANVISALTNVPLDRAVKKVTNIVDAGNEDIEYYKRVALALGWSAWELGIDKKGGKVAPPKTDMDKLYDLNKKQQIDSLLSLGISKKQIKALKLEEDRVNAILNPKSIKQIKVSKRDSLFGLNKKDQVKALEKLGLTKKEIRALRLESDRVEAIINKQKKEVE